MYQQQPPYRQPVPPRRGVSTRTAVLIAAGVGVVVLIFGAVGMLTDSKAFQDQPVAEPSSSAPAATPAQHLADLDGASGRVADYQAAIDKLIPKCTQDEERIAALGWAGHEDLAKNGISESGLSVLGHLDESVPAGQRMDCQGVLAAWLVLREKS